MKVKIPNEEQLAGCFSCKWVAWVCAGLHADSYDYSGYHLSIFGRDLSDDQVLLRVMNLKAGEWNYCVCSGKFAQGNRHKSLTGFIKHVICILALQQWMLP